MPKTWQHVDWKCTMDAAMLKKGQYAPPSPQQIPLPFFGKTSSNDPSYKGMIGTRLPSPHRQLVLALQEVAFVLLHMPGSSLPERVLVTEISEETSELLRAEGVSLIDLLQRYGRDFSVQRTGSIVCITYLHKVVQKNFRPTVQYETEAMWLSL
eukprot:TRINITY_DN124549_c0_g1_i1.p1 TRINITY_DN124549_c0_g1~~TRINITY_DN124549_c0_g1_i1.p1  ORF type:complete len:154 (-),score=36.31 TRINITY_DN124549_c0_g1_i1:567-1028(-)